MGGGAGRVDCEFLAAHALMHTDHVLLTHLAHSPYVSQKTFPVHSVLLTKLLTDSHFYPVPVEIKTEARSPVARKMLWQPHLSHLLPIPHRLTLFALFLKAPPFFLS